MMRLECPACAEKWERETRWVVVRGVLRPRPEPGEVRMNGELVATFGREEYACDSCGDPLSVGSMAAAITGGAEDRRSEWWRGYLFTLPGAP